MIAVCANHELRLFIQHRLHRCSRADIVPHSGFGLEINAELVRRLERGIGWTERVESNVIDTPVLVDLENSFPVRNVRRWITCQRKISAVMRAAEIDSKTVEL